MLYQFSSLITDYRGQLGFKWGHFRRHREGANSGTHDHVQFGKGGNIQKLCFYSFQYCFSALRPRTACAVCFTPVHFTLNRNRKDKSFRDASRQYHRITHPEHDHTEKLKITNLLVFVQIQTHTMPNRECRECRNWNMPAVTVPLACGVLSHQYGHIL